MKYQNPKHNSPTSKPEQLSSSASAHGCCCNGSKMGVKYPKPVSASTSKA